MQMAGQNGRCSGELGSLQPKRSHGQSCGGRSPYDTKSRKLVSEFDDSTPAWGGNNWKDKAVSKKLVKNIHFTNGSNT